jgi:hypothetical protein
VGDPTCSRCGAFAGFYVTRPRLKPLDCARMICLGTTDPGPGWWALVSRSWDVSDAPRESSWVPPVLVKLDGGKCQFCRAIEKPQKTKSLFEEEANP